MVEIALLKDLSLAVLGAATAGFVFHLLRLPLLLAYIVAGVLLGPHFGWGLIQGTENIRVISSIGLVLLMFILGLEIDLRKLPQAGRAVLVTGLFQFLLCALLAYFFFRLLGYGSSGPYLPVYLAVACSLSSTLVAVKILSDRLELDSLTSRITIGVLVIQDLWAILFMAIQPNLADFQAGSLALSLVAAVLLVAAALGLARVGLPAIFRRAGEKPELLMMVALAWCFAVCGLANALRLSLEMGALIAGVAVASYPYQVDVASRLTSLRDFFLSLFFVALGLQIPQPNAYVLGLAGAITAFVLASRFLTVFPILHFLNYGNRASLIPALNLSQVSEFSLVLASLGVATYGHLSPDVLSAFVVAMVATMLLSALVMPHGHRLYRAVNPLLEKLGFKDSVSAAEQGPDEERPQVVLLGFYREASSLLYELLAEYSGEALKQVMVVDFNPEANRRLKEAGVRCEYGDIGHVETLRHLGLEKSKILICTIPDHLLQGTSNSALLKNLKALSPKAQVVVTAETLESARQMYQSGADYVFLPRLICAHYLADVLERMRSGSGRAIRQAAKEYLTEREEVLP